MKKEMFWIGLVGLLLCLCIGAVVVRPGQKTSGYPHTNQAPGSALFVIAVTNETPKTNYNILVSELALQFTNGLATTGFVNQAAGSKVVVLGGTNAIVSVTATNDTNFYVVNSTVAANLPTGSTNWINLSVQAAHLPNTNYPGIDAGWQDWELVYYETNDIGTRLTLTSTWQFIVPPDYATNTMKLRLMTTLLTTNGPNSSNTIFQVSFLRATSGGAVDLHTNLFGFVAKGTNTWTASFDGTNKLQTLVIDTGTNSALSAGDFGIIKIGREAATDTFDGPTAVVGVQLEYTRQ